VESRHWPVLLLEHRTVCNVPRIETEVNYGQIKWERTDDV